MGALKLSELQKMAKNARRPWSIRNGTSYFVEDAADGSIAACDRYEDAEFICAAVNAYAPDASNVPMNLRQLIYNEVMGAMDSAIPEPWEAADHATGRIMALLTAIPASHEFSPPWVYRAERAEERARLMAIALVDHNEMLRIAFTAAQRDAIHETSGTTHYGRLADQTHDVLKKHHETTNWAREIVAEEWK